MNIKSNAIALALIALSLGAGCRSLPPQKDTAEPTLALESGSRIAGRVEKYSAEDGYIILRAVLQPAPGQMAYVLRGQTQVARVVFSKHSQFPYAAANIIHGTPQVGDLVVY